MRLGTQVHTRTPRDTMGLPPRFPLCAGRVHAVRRVSQAGRVRFLNQSFRLGKRYRERYVWLTLETTYKRLSMWYRGRAAAPWKRLKTIVVPLSEPVIAVPKRFACLHAKRQSRTQHRHIVDNSSKPANIAG